MNITIQKTIDNHHRIGVLGRLESAEERVELLEVLEKCRDDQKIEVEFYDADTLPPEIISALTERMESGRGGLSITCYHALLNHCLLRLGIAVKQIHRQNSHSSLSGIQAVALAGSANSLDKILTICEQLPMGDIAVFIVQHISEDKINLLDELLRVRTNYRVLMPQNMCAVEAGTMYIAPPGHHLKVAHGLVYLTRDRAVQFARPSIDVLFESLAGEYGNRAIAVLLCGFGQDGIAGCKAIKQAGGHVVIENPNDCQEARVLPESAKAAGYFDAVVSYQVITSILAAVAMGAEAKPVGNALSLFLVALDVHYGYDFCGYQQNSFERRMKSVLTSVGLVNFADFQLAVFSDVILFQRVVAELLVGSTEFFRHPEQFRTLRELILPYMESFPTIKIWSAGCSTGEEPYSLAIVLTELGLVEKSRLFATDVNHYFLELAKDGLYPVTALELGRKNYESGGGSASFDAWIEESTHYFSVQEYLRKQTLFYRHSLVDDGIFNEFQIIVCRNVMIYVTPEVQRTILRRFAQSLHRNGFLILGPQDGLRHLAQAEGFIPIASGSSIFRLQEGEIVND